jgi:hypothetical protein
MKKLRSIIIIWVTIIFLVTFSSLLTYVVAQQVIRLGADNLPATLAIETSIKLEKGQNPAGSVPDETIDILKSLETFVMIFDKDKNLIATSAMMGSEKPVYPTGVLDFVEKAGENRVTWQPVAGSPRESSHRFATVALKSGDYYIVAGRSLKEPERLTGVIETLILAAWAACAVFSSIALVIIYIFMKKVFKLETQ